MKVTDPTKGTLIKMWLPGYPGNQRALAVGDRVQGSGFRV